jgi:phytoene desaturase
LGTPQVNRFVDMTTYLRFEDEASARSVVVTADLDQLAHDLTALSPKDAPLVEGVLAGGRAARGLDMGTMGMESPPDLMGPLDSLRQVWAMRSFVRYFVGKHQKPIKDYARGVSDSFLRFVLENMFLPEVPVWFVSMILGLLADQQMGLLEGGSLSFVLPIERRYKDLGGEITYGSTVEEILVEDDKAVGVRLSDGTETRADVVISAADGYNTIFGMLGGRYTNKKIDTMYSEWQLIRPTVTINYGVAREFVGEPWLSTIRLERPLQVGRETINGIALRIFNYSDRFAPAGKTVVQVAFESEWDHWNDLHGDLRSYEAEKERVAAEVLDRLEAHYPGISGQVEMTDVATPYTTWRYTLNRRGAYMGWLPTPAAILTAVKRQLPGLDGFLMAGQWVMPGGGVPSCLYSGRHAAQILCHWDDKPFVVSTP